MTGLQTSWDDGAFRAAIQATLDGFVDEQAKRLEPLGDDADRLVTEARRSIAGGKRFRAAFCYWGFRAVQEPIHDIGHDEDRLLRAAAALELLHASALVHDDYMDASDVRRGRPATHKALETFHREQDWIGDPEQYGAAGAILLGDLLLSWSDELLRTCGFVHDVVREALAVFDSTRSEVITGQFLDVSSQARGDSEVKTAMRVLRYKSAKYSIERPLHIGAALAGGDIEVRSALSNVGLPLGEAFQLRDDLLGVFGNPGITGKPAGDDLREGKRTVLVALALGAAPAQEAKVLEDALGGSTGDSLSSAQVEVLQQVILDSGAHSTVEKMIEELTGRSLDALARAPISETARDVLRTLATAATQRVV
ncbi:MAG: polyprenyl synthetase family protein [Actinomycetota bacterium]|nr:polyprenyl synthetase family protein [Actinomycetota bacterium]